MQNFLMIAAILGIMLSAGAKSYAYQAETVTNGGAITGMVKYAGPAPKPERLEISKDREVCGARPLYNQALIVGANGGIENAVVSLVGIEDGKPLKPGLVKFDQKNCEYVPHVLAFPAGSTVDIINSDNILHSIHTQSRANPEIDMAQPGFKREMNVKITKPEVIKVTCDAHNWMEGWWYVTKNPYYAVTGPQGRFKIDDIPAGTYTLQVWQEKLGVEKQPVTVKPGQSVAVDFTMKPRT